MLIQDFTPITGLRFDEITDYKLITLFQILFRIFLILKKKSF